MPAAGDVLQVAATVAGLAIGLAALTENRGPEFEGVRVLPLALLLSAAPMLVGSLYAMAEILWEAGLPPWTLPWGRRHGDDGPDAPYTREALTLTTWGLYLLVVVYLVLLFSNQI